MELGYIQKADFVHFDYPNVEELAILDIDTLLQVSNSNLEMDLEEYRKLIVRIRIGGNGNGDFFVEIEIRKE